IDIFATNSAGTNQKSLLVSVGQSPSITSAVTASVAANANFTYILTAVGSPFPTLTFANLPTGLQASGAMLTGRVTTPGTYNITLKAQNSVGNDTKILVLTVGSIPKITSALTAAATVGTAFTYTATASGIPAPAFAFV